MYFPNRIEDTCYEIDHLEQVFSEIKGSFYYYWKEFISLSPGKKKVDISLLAEHFGTKSEKQRKSEPEIVIRKILDNAIQDFEKDRKKYLDILDPESLLEYQDDPSFFKNTVLRNQCPVIQSTLNNRLAKELDKYRRDFKN